MLGFASRFGVSVNRQWSGNRSNEWAYCTLRQCRCPKSQPCALRAYAYSRWAASVNRISLVSFALLLVISCVAPVWADPLADEMVAMNARWDAAINNADFDALLPMYTADARLMPPGAQPVIGAMAVRNFFAGRGRSTAITNLN